MLLNNEVGKIVNWAHIIQKNSGENESIREFAKNIEESGYYLVGSIPWAARAIKSFEVDEHLRNLLEKTAPRKSVVVDYQLNSPGTHIKVSPAQFQFIIKQLVNNAARAMPDNKEKRIHVATRRENHTVEILFQDFGPGISDEKRMAIFHWQYTTKETGGFGLLFTRQMVEDMQGTIKLLPYESGKGAVFLIRLPIERVEK